MDQSTRRVACSTRRVFRSSNHSRSPAASSLDARRSRAKAEQLAADGVRFKNSFCSFPVCTPSRYSLLSGLPVHEHRGWNNRCTLPPGTRLRQAFYDDDSATLYLDFRPELVTRHPGGSAAEYFTLSSIVRTLGTNFPEVARVQILVDGQPIESLAGHFDASKPIEIATWQ